jgi:hypothetical protein
MKSPLRFESRAVRLHNDLPAASLRLHARALRVTRRGSGESQAGGASGSVPAARRRGHRLKQHRDYIGRESFVYYAFRFISC